MNHSVTMSSARHATCSVNVSGNHAPAQWVSNSLKMWSLFLSSQVHEVIHRRMLETKPNLAASRLLPCMGAAPLHFVGPRSGVHCLSSVNQFQTEIQVWPAKVRVIQTQFYLPGCSQFGPVATSFASWIRSPGAPWSEMCCPMSFLFNLRIYNIFLVYQGNFDNW